jgi:hypothetical protein
MNAKWHLLINLRADIQMLHTLPLIRADIRVPHLFEDNSLTCALGAEHIIVTVFSFSSPDALLLSNTLREANTYGTLTSPSPRRAGRLFSAIQGPGLNFMIDSLSGDTGRSRNITAKVLLHRS